MEFTRLGQTGLTVSRVCLGTGTFGKQTDEVEAFRIFDKATKAGVTFIDTADLYPPGVRCAADLLHARSEVSPQQREKYRI